MAKSRPKGTARPAVPKARAGGTSDTRGKISKSKGKSSMTSFSKSRKKAFSRSQHSEQQTTRAHRFVSFSSRLASINVDPLRLARQQFDTGVDAAHPDDQTASYFRAALDRWKLTNLSQNFTSFVDAVDSLAETLPQIIHHETIITEALLEHVRVGDGLSLEPLLSAMAALVHDLGARFSRFVGPAIAAISSIVLKQVDADVVEWAFACLVWLFKYLSRLLVTKLPEVYDMMRPLLGVGHKRQFVVHFAAEAMAFLVRKAASRAGKDVDPLRDTVRLCVQSVCDNVKDGLVEGGLVVMFREAATGVQKSSHAHAGRILSELATAACANPSQGVASLLGSLIVDLAGNLTEAEFSTALIGLLDTAIATLRTERPAVDSTPVVAEICFSGAQKVSPRADKTVWIRLLDVVAELLASASKEDLPTLLTALSVILVRAPILVGLSGSAQTAISSVLAASPDRFLAFCSVFFERCNDSEREERVRQVVLTHLQTYLDRHQAIDDQSDETELVDFLVRMGRWKGLDKLAVRLPANLVESFCRRIETGTQLAMSNAYISLFFTETVLVPDDGLSRARIDDKVRSAFADIASTGQVSSSQRFFTGSLFKFGLKRSIVRPDVELLGLAASVASKLSTSLSFWEGFQEALLSVKKNEPEPFALAVPNLTDRIGKSVCSAVAGPSHDIRLLVLDVVETLSTADQSSPQNELIQRMFSIESRQVTVDAVREVAADLQRLGAGYGRLFSSVDSAPASLLRDFVPAFCFGKLFAEISQTGTDAGVALEEIAKSGRIGEEAVISRAFSWVSSDGLTGRVDEDETVGRAGAASIFQADRRRLPAELRTAAFDEISAEQNDRLDGLFEMSHSIRPFRVTLRELGLRLLQRIAGQAERRARELVDVVIAWGSTSASEPSAVSRSWTMTDKKLLLGLFSKFSNPVSLPQAGRVYSALLTLCASGDVEIQKSALAAVMRWPSKPVAKHAPTLRGLLDEAQFRERVVLLTGAESAVSAAQDAAVEGTAGVMGAAEVLLESERADVMPIVLRLLFGRLVCRSGRGGLQKRRRRAVLGALARCRADEADQFVQMALAGLEAPDLLDRLDQDDGSMGNRKLSGIVSLATDLIAVFGGTLGVVPVERVALAVVYIALRQGSDLEMDDDDEHDEDDEQGGDLEAGDDDDIVSIKTDVHNSPSQAARRVRNKATHVLSSIFHHYPSLPVWSSVLPVLFDRLVQPRLARFTAEAAAASTATSGLMRLVGEWSSSGKMVGWLSEFTDVLSPMVTALTQSTVHSAVKKAVLAMINSLVSVASGLIGASGKGSGGSDAGDDNSQKGRQVAASILTAHAPIILTSVESVLRNRPEPGLAIKSVEVTVGLAKYVSGESSFSALVRLAASIAADRRVEQTVSVEEAEIEGDGDDDDDDEEVAEPAASKDQDKVSSDNAEAKDSVGGSQTKPGGPGSRAKLPFTLRLAALRLVKEYLPLSDVPPSLADGVAADVGSMFAVLSSVSSRLLLSDVLAAIGEASSVASIQATAAVVGNITALGRLGSIDFDRRLGAMAQFADDSSGIGDRIGNTGWKIIVTLCLAEVRMTDDMALRAAASRTVIAFIRAAQSGKIESGPTVVDRTVVPALRRGLRHRSEPVRAEMVMLLDIVIAAFSSGTSVSALGRLRMDGDVEASVLANIAHIQQHRRVRAVRRIGELAEKHPFPSGAVVSVLLPLIDPYIPADRGNSADGTVLVSDDKLDLVATEALAAISRLAVCLSLSALRSAVDRARRAVSVAVPGRFAVRRFRAWLDGFTAWVSSGRASDDEKEAVERFLRDRVLATLADFFHRQSEATIPARLGLLGAVARAIATLPQPEANGRMENLLAETGHILRSRNVDIRDSCRSAICEVLAITGPSGLGLLIPGLKTALRLGSQRHVLGFTVHAALVAVEPVAQVGDLDNVAADIMAVCLDDVAGLLAEEKNSSDYTGKTKEVRSQKGFDAAEIVSRLVSLAAVKGVVEPFQDLVSDRGMAGSSGRKVLETLRRVGVGLGVNPAMRSEAGLVLCWELVSGAHSMGRETKGRKKKAVVVTSGTNPRLATFGLDLLRLLLSRDTSLRTARLLTGLVPVVCDAAVSTHTEVQTAAFRLVTVLLGFAVQLPALDAACQTLVSEAVKSVDAASATTSDSAQAALKMVAAVLKTGAPVKLAHLAFLLGRIKTDLTEPDRHGLPFALLNAIIGRRVELAELYDVMDSVATAMVTNQTRTVRDAAAAAYVRFLTDCPQSHARFGQQIDFLAANLAYSADEGVATVLEVVHLVLTRFDDALVKQAVVDKVFVPVVLVMINGGTRVRAMAELVVQDIFGLADGLDGVVSTISAWTEGGKMELRVVSVRLWTLWVTSGLLPPDKVDFLVDLASRLIESATIDKAESSNEWELTFHALVMVEKLVTAEPLKIASHPALWNSIVRAQRASHGWVKTVSTRLISRALKAKLAATCASAAEGEQTDVELVDVLSDSQLAASAVQAIGALSIEGAAQDLLDETAGLAVVLARYFTEKLSGTADDDDEADDDDDGTDSEEGDDGEEDGNNPKAVLSTMFDRISKVIRSEDAARTVAGLKTKQAVLAVIQAVLTSTLADGEDSNAENPAGNSFIVGLLVAKQLLRPLLTLTSTADMEAQQRENAPSSAPLSAAARARSETGQAGSEVLLTVRRAVGTDRYVQLVRSAQRAVDQAREGRRKRKRIDAVKETGRAERDKKRKREREKERKKGRSREFGGKRRGW